MSARKPCSVCGAVQRVNKLTGAVVWHMRPIYSRPTDRTIREVCPGSNQATETPCNTAIDHERPV